MHHICAVLTLIVSVWATVAQAQDYVLSTGDTLRVTLLESSRANGDYVVGPDGRVSIPGIGLIAAAGLELRAFEAALRAEAERTIVDPSVAVQIAEYRPFYVLGDVDDAGEYPFSPGMNIMRAIAIAGGFGRQGGQDSFSRTVASNTAEKSLEDARIELYASVISLARFRAERRMDTAFDVVPAVDGIAPPPNLDQMVADARTLFATRQEAFTTRLSRQTATLEARRREAGSYREQIEAQRAAVAANDAELAELRDARARGLITGTRMSEVMRDSQNTRAQMLQTNTLQRQAEANVTATEQALSDLIVGRAVEIDQGIETMTRSIEQLQSRIRIDMDLIEQADAPGGPVMTGGPRYRYELYPGSTSAGRAATLDELLAPGDMVFVIRIRDPQSEG